MSHDNQGAGTPTVMWEVKAPPNKYPELLDWIDSVAVPAVRASGAEVTSYASADFRAAIIATGPGIGGDLPLPPADLVARPAKHWLFTRR
ncbi:hypothetical protein JMUB6875_31580 [Nocardia sp. JMUB6875]|uniref:hypothetical protein n=1 Tax=Nocardia sp. JMUB6875 TaxID=3158170 RepID=UPI0032E68A0F